MADERATGPVNHLVWALAGTVVVLVAVIVVLIASNRSGDGNVVSASPSTATTLPAPSTTTNGLSTARSDASSSSATAPAAAPPSSTSTAPSTNATPSNATPSTTPAASATTNATAAPPTTALKLTEAQYQAAALDCVYGNDSKGSCAQLVAAGYSAERNYGLGNSLSQAPLGALRSGCSSDPLQCAELERRVAQRTPDSKTLVCFFYPFVIDQSAPVRPADALHLKAVLDGAPSGVLAALDVIGSGTRTQAALSSLTGYVGPICS